MPSWKTVTIQLSPMLFTRRVLIARRWQQFYHNMHSSRIDCRLTRRRNLLWGQPLLLLWTLHLGGVLNARKTAFSGKLFRRGPVKTFRGGKYLYDVIQAQLSFLYLPKGLESVCQVTERKGF